jgi:dTDP-4-dehydrorhamnose 3,5-epimerase
MHEEDIKIIDLEKHETKNIHDQHVNGSLTVIWRDWDNFIKNPPKMVYVSSVNPGEIKGPHIHTKRNSYFVCIHGKVLFVIKNEKGEYVERISTADDPVLIFFPHTLPFHSLLQKAPFHEYKQNNCYVLYGYEVP